MYFSAAFSTFPFSASSVASWNNSWAERIFVSSWAQPTTMSTRANKREMLTACFIAGDPYDKTAQTSRGDLVHGRVLDAQNIDDLFHRPVGEKGRGAGEPGVVL